METMRRQPIFKQNKYGGKRILSNSWGRNWHSKISICYIHRSFWVYTYDIWVVQRGENFSAIYEWNFKRILKIHLRQLFERFLSYGLTINVEKCELNKSELCFLGYLVIFSFEEPVRYVLIFSGSMHLKIRNTQYMI